MARSFVNSNGAAFFPARAARAGIASGTIARLRRREAVGDGETYERLLRLVRQHRAYGNASVGEL
jgi:hypothetical protein